MPNPWDSLLTGTWVLNQAVSKYPDSRLPKPAKFVMELRLSRGEFSCKTMSERDGRLRTIQWEATIGGMPHVSDEAGIIAVNWQRENRPDQALSVQTRYNPNRDHESSIDDVWTLSADGKRLTSELVYHVPKNAQDKRDIRVTRVFDKQP